MLTMGSFSPNNRTKVIGYSMYRICNTDPVNGKGLWYIHETYNNGTEWSGNNAYHSEELESVIGIFNNILEEKEIVKLRFNGGIVWRKTRIFIV